MGLEEQAFTGDFTMTRFAGFAEFGVLVDERRAARHMRHISGLDERQFAELCKSNTARLGTNLKLAAGAAGEVKSKTSGSLLIVPGRTSFL